MIRSITKSVNFSKDRFQTRIFLLWKIPWLDASVKHRIDEQREAQKMRAEALRMETEKLAARNQQARQDLQARQSLAPW